MCFCSYAVCLPWQPHRSSARKRGTWRTGGIFFTPAAARPATPPRLPPNAKIRITEDSLTLTGGRCLKSAFGTFYVPNITPDKQSGIGGWSDEDFIKAMTAGVSPAGKRYYPAFPFTSYRHMTREDLLDLKAFLDTLPAVASSVPKNELSFPYNVRSGLIVWDRLNLDGGTFVPDPSKSAQLNRGAYLVQGPGHCGECHTPRDWLGATIKDKRLSGAPSPDGKGFVPNITPRRHRPEVMERKRHRLCAGDGFHPRWNSLGGSMTKVQDNTAKLTPEDRDAIAAYLKSIPPIANARPKKKGVASGSD